MTTAPAQAPIIVPPANTVAATVPRLSHPLSWDIVNSPICGYIVFIVLILVSLYWGATWHHIEVGPRSPGTDKPTAPPAPRVFPMGNTVDGCQNDLHKAMPTALIACHRVGEPAATRWLNEERLRNREAALTKENCRRDWAARRCFMFEGAALFYDDFDTLKINTTWQSVVQALRAMPPNWREEWQPVTRHAFVDFAGDVYVRVVAYRDGAFAPLLLSLDALLDALAEWQGDIDDALGGNVRPACVCPQHLGIIGSKMFLRYEGAENGWNVVFDAAVRSRTQERTRYKYARAHHTFPLVGDEHLLPTLDNRTFYYATSATLTAMSVSEFANPSVVEKLDSLVRQEWDAPEPYMVILPIAGSGIPIDATKVADSESECFARCDRLEARMQELAPPPPPPPPPAPVVQEGALGPVIEEPASQPARKKPGGRRRVGQD